MCLRINDVCKKENKEKKKKGSQKRAVCKWVCELSPIESVSLEKTDSRMQTNFCRYEKKWWTVYRETGGSCAEKGGKKMTAFSSGSCSFSQLIWSACCYLTWILKIVPAHPYLCGSSFPKSNWMIQCMWLTSRGQWLLSCQLLTS